MSTIGEVDIAEEFSGTEELVVFETSPQAGGFKGSGIQGVRVLEISSGSSRHQRSWNFKYSDPLNPLKRLTGLWACLKNHQSFDSTKLFSDVHLTNG
jgi:hypothetical protein